MTVALSGNSLTSRIEAAFPGSVLEATETSVVVKSGVLHDVARFLRDTSGLDFDYLSSITAVDYLDYFEVVYHFTSMVHNHSTVLKTRCYQRDGPSVPSVLDLWRGADFQEREVYDLMGIAFEGRPNLKRLFLWEGFEGHPLRKDFP